jgi:hypothetical protein
MRCLYSVDLIFLCRLSLILCVFFPQKTIPK